LALCAAADQGLSAETGALHALFLRELELFEFQARLRSAQPSGCHAATLRLLAAAQLSRAATVSGANEREQDNYAQLLATLETRMGQARP
jgi:hypothetical protein